MAKAIKFDMRITKSGSSGIAFYVPAEIVKITKLKDLENHKVQAVLDEDGDIITYLGSLEKDDKDE